MWIKYVLLNEITKVSIFLLKACLLANAFIWPKSTDQRR